MDELELRIAAVELALYEVFADLPPDHLAKARAQITDTLHTAGDPDEVAARGGAIDLIRLAEERYVLMRIAARSRPARRTH